MDPSIVKHRIDTWLDVAHVFQKKILVHPSKVVAVKAKIEKLLKVGFIYPIAYTTWVSNLVTFNKRQGTIRVYNDFHNLNLACPKDILPIAFIDHIIDSYARHEVFSFMDGFSG